MDEAPVDEAVVEEELEAGLAEPGVGELLKELDDELDGVVDELDDELVEELDVCGVDKGDEENDVVLVDEATVELLLDPAQGLPGTFRTAPMSNLFQSTPGLVSLSCWNVQFSFSEILYPKSPAAT